MGNRDSHAGVFLAVFAAAMFPVAALVGLIVLLLTVIAPPSSASCSTGAPVVSATGGEWLATAYGPPWEGIQGDGITATGIDLRPAKPAYIIAVDPTVIALGSYVHVSPNPFGDDAIAFEAADTGGAIIGKHIDIYDWQGRAAQDAWGARHVTLTPAVKTGAGPLLEATPGAGLEAAGEPGEVSECETGETGRPPAFDTGPDGEGAPGRPGRRPARSAPSGEGHDRGRKPPGPRLLPLRGRARPVA